MRGHEILNNSIAQKKAPRTRPGAKGRTGIHAVVAVLYVSPYKPKGCGSVNYQRTQIEQGRFVSNILYRIACHPGLLSCSAYMHSGIAESEDDLIVQQRVSTSSIGRLIDSKDEPKPNVLLGLVDRKFRTPAEIKNIYSEIYKIGDKKMGAVTVCTSAQSLLELIAQNGGNTRYFPGNILRKMNFMLGGTNFQTNAMGLDDNAIFEKFKDTMIVGAHVSHAGSGAVKHFPSIVSVVASKDRERTQYPGSARLQQRHRQKEVNNEILVYEDGCIDELKEMMAERLRKWQKTAPSILYFRDGLPMDSTMIKDIVEIETRQIKEAYSQQFPNRPNCEVTYVTVNKGRMRSNFYDNLGGKSFITKVAPNSRPVIYTVHHDDKSRDLMELEKLVSTQILHAKLSD